MLLKGSCHCQSVTFKVQSENFYPYAKCYCSICRKTQGGGGFSINLAAEFQTLKIKGKKYISIYRALIKRPGTKRKLRSSGERNFCKRCGSFLWLYDPSWPNLVHPFASAVDTELPKVPESIHLMLAFKPHWVDVAFKKRDKKFNRYPLESIAQWHQRVISKKRKLL